MESMGEMTPEARSPRNVPSAWGIRLAYPIPAEWLKINNYLNI